MNIHPVLVAIVFFILLTPGPARADANFVHHDLQVAIYPGEHRLIVRDAITLPKDFPNSSSFTLHTGLKPASATPLVRIEKKTIAEASSLLDSYTVILPPGLRAFVLTYEGTIYHPVEQNDAEQARGMAETPGIIADEGVYLSSGSGWYPDFNAGLMTFTLDLKLPGSWDAVSQGERALHDRGGNITTVRWVSPEPQDSIFLIAGRFTEYDKQAGRAQAMAFLRTPDQALAQRYLDATANYLDLYNKLIGPYPYKKFALVENFWETGFGMPSFTLLGPKVVRLPFIINTSYPHEILHNWWGNSVFPDLEQGNWSEGLTAYLADHLMKEQQGMGAEYRLNTLQKYADYALAGRDFPLTRFRSRHSSSSEAIGYGKALMFFHMLRLELGDETFRLGLKEFYKQYRFRFATFGNIRTSMETVSGRALGPMFEQWISRIGAPQLKVSNPVVTQIEGGFRLNATLEQAQGAAPYQLRVPIAVTLENTEQAIQTTVEMTAKQADLQLLLPARPLRLDVDPEFDVFRRLDRAELPPAISQALGSHRMLIVLPSSGSAKLRAAYREFAQTLSQSGPDEVEVATDEDIKTLPHDRSVTILGWENRFFKAVTPVLSGYDVAFSAKSIRIDRTEVQKQGHAVVLTARAPQNLDQPLMFIAADPAEALPGLAQKLPHYHKYSYLAFEGREPANVAKGRWPVTDSPMTIFIPLNDKSIRKAEMGRLAPRDPLAGMTPVFSQERMIETVRFLASEDLKGRGFGSEGLDKAAEYIAKKFKEAGLVPNGPIPDAWFQTWEDRGGDPERTAVMKNVIGVLPGKDSDRIKESVVIGAHYDHLGLGWPETRDKTKGTIHPGADDNASGVAVLIELARVLAKGPQPDRTIVFIAFTGEEAGKRGSRHYVATELRRPVEQCIAMVNLDTVGRLGKNKLLVLGAGSAKEWVPIFRGAGFVTNVEIETVARDLDSSDQKSFQEANVPAVQLFSGPNLDYHRSTDTADKIDPEGMAKVASVAKEAIEYLAERKDPLTPVNAPALALRQQPSAQRKVSLGTIPDFAYSGKGFRISGVTPGSPAEAIGLKEGDVIVTINATAINDLPGFSDMLKTLKPGDKVKITYLRDGRTLSAEAVVAGR